MAIQGFFTGDVKIKNLNGVLKAVDGVVEVATDAGTVTSVGIQVGSTGTDVNIANSPVTTSGNITLNLPTASATNRGLLSSADWAIFDAKQGSITLTTTGNNGSATLTSGTLNIPTYTLAGLGGISLTSLSASSPLAYNNTTGAFSIQVANGSQNGYLSSSDWTTFNSKQSALTFSSPLVNNAGTVSIPAATSSVNGYLTSTDWATFNNKQGTITLTTTGSSGAATLIGTTLNIPNYSNALSGYVPTSRQLTINGTTYDLSANRSWSVGTVTSVGLTMPSAFAVSSSPVTGSGTIAVTGAGVASQYIRGDGTLANFPTSGGGGSSVSYYLNGSVNQGTFVGNTYYEMNKVPVIGAGTDFTINANGYIAQFITDAGDPALLEIPAGNWNFEMYFSASSGGGTPSFYIELYKYNGSTFTLISSSSASPEAITNGTSIDLYTTALAVPTTALTLTDRLAIRVYVTHSGRTITLHTENSHLCQVITTFSTGITALNGLTAQVQYFQTGTSGTDFNIASATATHTFNLPTASATNRGALSSADWTTFNNKQSALNGTGFIKISGTTISYDNSTYYLASNPNAYIALTALSATSPLSYNNITGVFSISQATTSTNGYLSSTDWNTFNNKQAAGNYITALTGEATASGPGSASVTLSTSAVTGKLLTGLNLTGGGSIAATDSILQAFGKVQNQISGLAGGVTYQGTWNASTNTPTLTSSVGTKGYYYIVDVAGSTNLNGITDWKIGDWAIFNGSTWDKVDNTDAVSSVNGFTGAVSLTTSNIAEGTNLYYLDSRARLALSFTAGSGGYNNTTGVITIPTNTSQLTNGANFITLSSLSASSPLSYNNVSGAFSIQVANGSQNGYLSSSDWTTFNSKQAALTLTTTGSSGSSTLVGATLNVPTYTLSGLGGVPTTRTLTINGTAYDLSADRSWSVGTHTGSLTTGYVPKATGSTSLTDGLLYDTGSAVLIGTQTASTSKFMVYSATADNHYQAIGSAPSFRFADTITSPTYTGIIGLATASNHFITGAVAGDMVLANNTTSSIGNFIFGTGSTERMRITPTGNVSINNTNNTYRLDVNGTVRFTGQLRLESTITNGTYTYTLPGATGTIALVGGAGVGTVTSIATTGPITGGTITSTGTIGITQSGAASDGYLSSTDWNTFNNKQSALTNPVTGTGTTNYLPKFTGASTIGNSGITDDNTTVTYGAGSGLKQIYINGGGYDLVLGASGGGVFGFTSTNISLVFSTTAKPLGIGTNAAQPLIFGTSAAERMRLDASGNLMVGSTDAGNAGSINVSVGVAGTTSGGLQLWAATNQTHYIQFGDGTTGASPYTGYVGYAHSTDSLIFGTATSTRMTLNASGNLGLGVSPSAWGSSAIALQIRNGSIWNYNNADNLIIASNNYFDVTNAAYRYVITGFASEYTQDQGKHIWRTAPSGTAGNAISFTQAMTLNASGFLGIGETNPTSRLHIQSSASGGQNIRVVTSVAAGRNYMQFANGSGDMGYIGYGGADSKFYINNQLNDDMLFVNNGATRLTIASTGAATFSSSVTAGGQLTFSSAIGSFSSYGIGRNNQNELQFNGGTSGYIFNNAANGANLLKITDTGNVGIGTTSPNARLQVQVDTDFTGGVNYSTPHLFVRSGASAASGNVTRFAMGIFDGAQVYLDTICTSTGGGAADLAISTRNVGAPTEKMRITSGGNVGIGTTSILGSSVERTIHLAAPSNGYATLYLTNGANTLKGIFAVAEPTSSIFVGSQSNHSFSIVTNDTARLTIASTGVATFSSSVGVGGYGAGYSNLESSSGTFGSTVSLISLAIKDGTYNPRSTISYRTQTGSAYAVIFDSGYSSGWAATNWCFNSGNVGIGTTSPGATYSELLQVSKADTGRINITHTNTTGLRQSDVLFTEGTSLQLQVGSILGSGTFNDQNWIRGVANIPLVLYTNDTERMRITSDGNLLINTTTNSGNKLEVNGTARFGSVIVGSLGTGAVFSNGGTLTNTNPSDRRLKTNIIPLTYGLADILKLNPVSYNWKDGTNGKQFGFIAQDVQEVMPDAVKNGEYLGLEKDAIYSALVNAIKEQQAQINELKSQLK